MKIIHVVAGSLAGGAAIGALQLHKSLLQMGVDSLLLNNFHRGQDENEKIKGIYPGCLFWLVPRVRARMDRLPLRAYPTRKKTAWSCGLMGTSLTRITEVREADIVHLHWINEGFIKMPTIGESIKPVVWTMRDMWPLTGGCHYSLGCKKYETHCGACFQLGSKKEEDLSYRLFNKKREMLGKSIFLVGVSKWLSDCARASGICTGHEVRTICNGASTEMFGALESGEARRKLGLPLDRKIILVGAQDLFFPYKGGEFLTAALREPLVVENNPLLVSFGRGTEKLRQEVSLDLVSFGFISDQAKLASLYAAADVFVMASVQEAFGKTVVEALASGTPVVCFDTGGHGEVVRHGIEGFKAEPMNCAGLAFGIAQVMKMGRDYFKEGAENRAKEYDVKKSARLYLDLYNEIMGSNASSSRSIRQSCC
jgi:glycosyltransferase involved in cell wall biosynthesis